MTEPSLVQLASLLQRDIQTGRAMLPAAQGSGTETLMLAGFLLKQLNHAESVLLLAGQPDSRLIARTMYEGAVFIVWATETGKLTERAACWLEHSAVSAYRKYVSVSDADENKAVLRQYVLEGLQRSGAASLKRSSRADALKELSVDRFPAPSGFQKDWDHAAKAEINVAEESMLGGRVEGEIAEFHGWHHWDSYVVLGTYGGDLSKDIEALALPRVELLAPMYVALLSLEETMRTFAIHFGILPSVFEAKSTFREYIQRPRTD
jgi:hypothetical protein